MHAKCLNFEEVSVQQVFAETSITRARFQIAVMVVFSWVYHTFVSGLWGWVKKEMGAFTRNSYGPIATPFIG